MRSEKYWKIKVRTLNHGETLIFMPVEIVGGYPCNCCGGWEIEVKKECQFYWVDFGILLAESITNYVCKSCKRILIKVIEHKCEIFVN